MRTVEEIKADIASCDSSWIDSALCRSLRCELYETILDGIPLDRLETICAAEKDGRLVTLPVGKIGDIVEWDSGVCKELFLIRGIVIYCDGTRYDLGEFMPVVTDEHICCIIPRAEAEKALEKEAQS